MMSSKTALTSGLAESYSTIFTITMVSLLAKSGS
jgi:hypothetical protein